MQLQINLYVDSLNPHHKSNSDAKLDVISLAKLHIHLLNSRNEFHPSLVQFLISLKTS